jgi:hypothetical protein
VDSERTQVRPIVPDILDLLIDRPKPQHIFRCRPQQPSNIAVNLAKPEWLISLLDDDWHLVLDPAKANHP